MSKPLKTGLFLFYKSLTMNKTEGQIKDEITKKAIIFYRQTLGVGPEKTKIYVIDDMIIIRLFGRLLPIEQKLLQQKEGYKIVKSLREALYESTAKEMSQIIEEVINKKVISVHSDISTKTGEIIQIFVINEKIVF